MAGAGVSRALREAGGVSISLPVRTNAAVPGVAFPGGLREYSRGRLLEVPLKVLVMATCRWWNATAEGALLGSRALERAGIDVLLTGQPGSPILAEAGSEGIRTAPLRLQGASMPVGLASLDRLLSRFRPDFIIAHRSEDQLAAVIAHGRVPVVRVRSDIRRPSRSRLSRLVDAHTALEAYSSPFMSRAGYGRGRSGPVAVVPQPVDTGRFRPGPGGPPGTFVMAARLSEVKGHSTALRALRDAPAARLVVAGADAQITERQLRDEAQSLGVSARVEFTGFVGDIRTAYGRASIGLVPSLASEAVSRAALEMMACGLPVLAAATNGLVDTISDGRTGLLHPPGDSAALGRQMAYLASHPEVAGRMAVRARNACEELYSLDSVGFRWRRLLEALRDGWGTGAAAPGYHGWSGDAPPEDG